MVGIYKLFYCCILLKYKCTPLPSLLVKINLENFNFYKLQGWSCFFILSKVAVISISYILSVLPLPSQITHEELLFCTRVLLSNKPQKFWKIRAGGLGKRMNSISIVYNNLDGENSSRKTPRFAVCLNPWFPD